MTYQQIQMITSLNGCTFLPGSFDKRFVRSLHAQAAIKPNKPLTLVKEETLVELFHKYRKQIGSEAHTRLCVLCQQASLRASREERAG